MSPVRRLAAGALAAAVVILATALPASAHDELVQSTPAADERLESPPETISLVFSGDLITLGDSAMGAVVLVVDESGRDWASGAPEVNGNTVTVGVEPGMPVAGYQVRWQVVSQDGHPIAGLVPFTVGDADPLVTQKAGSARPDVDEGLAEQTADETEGSLRALLVGAGGAVLAAGAFLFYTIIRRRRATAAASDEDAAETHQ